MSCLCDAALALAEVLRRCDERERENPWNTPGEPPNHPSWITVADVRNAAKMGAPS